MRPVSAERIRVGGGKATQAVSVIVLDAENSSGKKKAVWEKAVTHVLRRRL